MSQQSIETEITIPIRVFFTPVKAEKTIKHPVDFAHEGHPAYVDIDEIKAPFDNAEDPLSLFQYMMNNHGEELYNECMEWLRINRNE